MVFRLLVPTPFLIVNFSALTGMRQKPGDGFHLVESFLKLPDDLFLLDSPGLERKFRLAVAGDFLFPCLVNGSHRSGLLPHSPLQPLVMLA